MVVSLSVRRRCSAETTTLQLAAGLRADSSGHKNNGEPLQEHLKYMHATHIRDLCLVDFAFRGIGLLLTCSYQIGPMGVGVPGAKV